jgi:hypothetical protein
VTHTVRARPKPPVTNAPASGSSSGSTLSVKDFSGNTLRVTVPGVVDPATATSPGINGPSAGKRLIAVELSLQDQGPGSISDNANTDGTVIGSDSQDYTPSFSDVTGCTNFNHGDYALSVGSTQRGCVVFELPNGVTVNAFQFALGDNTVDFNK